MADKLENDFVELTEEQLDEVSGGVNEWGAAGGAISGGLAGWQGSRGSTTGARITQTATGAIGGGMLGGGS